MRLLLENCYRFNGPDHSISRKAQRIETLLEQKLALLSRYCYCHPAFINSGPLLRKRMCGNSVNMPTDIGSIVVDVCKFYERLVVKFNDVQLAVFAVKFC